MMKFSPNLQFFFFDVFPKGSFQLNKYENFIVEKVDNAANLWKIQMLKK